MKEISCIYEIKNIVNQHRYIGQTKNFYTRKRKHMNDLKKNKHKNDYLQNAWNKYGEKNFEFNIIEICDILDLDSKEIFECMKIAANKYNIDYRMIICSCKNKCIVVDSIWMYYDEYITYTEEDLQKIISEAEYKRNKGKKKSVICINTNEIFDSVKEASKKYNLDKSSLSKCCRNKAKYCGKDSFGNKLRWSFVKE